MKISNWKPMNSGRLTGPSFTLWNSFLIPMIRLKQPKDIRLPPESISGRKRNSPGHYVEEENLLTLHVYFKSRYNDPDKKIAPPRRGNRLKKACRKVFVGRGIEFPGKPRYNNRQHPGNVELIMKKIKQLKQSRSRV